MKKVIIPALTILIVNIIVGLLLSSYPLANMLFTSITILVNTLLTVILFLAAVGPDHVGGLSQLDDLSNPIDDAGMPRFRRDIADIDCR